MMTGTSLDGLDLAYCRFTGKGAATAVELLAFDVHPIPNALKLRIQSCLVGGTAQEICRLHYDLGRFYAEEAKRFFSTHRLDLEQLDLVGNHGQTIWHEPGHSTLQLGQAAFLAQALGVPVVQDFRAADVAAGGQGAPLVPYLDRHLFAQTGQNRVLLNLGGMANCTFLGAQGQVVAMDTGPCNAILNELTEVITQGSQQYDHDGEIAFSGKLDTNLVNRLLLHPYFSRRAPKSTGREEFGKAFVENLLATEAGRPLPDLMRSLVRLAAVSIAQGVHQLCGKPDQVWAAGGGLHNPVLMQDLNELLGVHFSALEAPFPPDAKEAVAFALLAHERLNGIPTNLPQATGAGRAVCLGEITLP